MLLGFISVDSALDFDISNQTKLNYWGRDLILDLPVKYSYRRRIIVVPIKIYSIKGLMKEK